MTNMLAFTFFTPVGSIGSLMTHKSKHVAFDQTSASAVHQQHIIHKVQQQPCSYYDFDLFSPSGSALWMLVRHSGVLIELTLKADLDTFNIGSFVPTFARAMQIEKEHLHVEVTSWHEKRMLTCEG